MVLNLAHAREANDFVADIVNKNPKRFAGFAALPVAAPDQAAEQLDRRSGSRLQGHHDQRPLARPLPLGAYLRENVHYTFAGLNFPAAFLDCCRRSGSIGSCSRSTIAHGNAERLFNL